MSPPFVVVVVEVVPVEAVRVTVVIEVERVVAVGITAIRVAVKVERWWRLA